MSDRLKAIYDLVMAAYTEDFNKWKVKITQADLDVDVVLDAIIKLEEQIKVKKSKIFGKSDVKEDEKTLERYKDALDRLERRRDRLEKEKPNVDFYDLGSIDNTLFYSKTQP